MSERMNKFKNKPSLTSEELEQVTGGLGIKMNPYGEITGDTAVYADPQGTKERGTLAMGTKVTVFKSNSYGFTFVVPGGDSRNSGYVATDVIGYW